MKNEAIAPKGRNVGIFSHPQSSLRVSPEAVQFPHDVLVALSVDPPQHLQLDLRKNSVHVSIASSQFPHDFRYAVEIRNAGLFGAEYHNVLETHGVRMSTTTGPPCRR